MPPIFTQLKPPPSSLDLFLSLFHFTEVLATYWWVYAVVLTQVMPFSLNSLCAPSIIVFYASPTLFLFLFQCFVNLLYVLYPCWDFWFIIWVFQRCLYTKLREKINLWGETCKKLQTRLWIVDAVLSDRL